MTLDTPKVFRSTRSDTAERPSESSGTVSPGDWFVARGIVQQARTGEGGALAWHDADSASLPAGAVGVCEALAAAVMT